MQSQMMHPWQLSTQEHNSALIGTHINHAPMTHTIHFGILQLHEGCIRQSATGSVPHQWEGIARQEQ